MAHDRQYKDEDRPYFVMNGVQVTRFDYPKVGEWFYNRATGRVEQVVVKMNKKFLVVEKGEAPDGNDK